MRQIDSYLKYTVATLLLSCFCLVAFTQTKDPYEMTINGVKIIVQPSGNEIVEIQTVIKGGVQNYPANKAGIEKLAMTALTECGTQKDDKNSFKNKLDEVDAMIYGSSGKDASHFQLNCIKSDLESVWPLYVDAMTAPKFDAKEFARILIIVSTPLGVAAILVGAYLSFQAVGTGLIFGGILAISWGYWSYWWYLDDWIRFVSLLAGFAVAFSELLR